MDDARCRDFLIEEMEMGVAKCIDCSVGLVDTRMIHDQNDFLVETTCLYAISCVDYGIKYENYRLLAYFKLIYLKRLI